MSFFFYLQSKNVPKKFFQVVIDFAGPGGKEANAKDDVSKFLDVPGSIHFLEVSQSLHHIGT